MLLKNTFAAAVALTLSLGPALADNPWNASGLNWTVSQPTGATALSVLFNCSTATSPCGGYAWPYVQLYTSSGAIGAANPLPIVFGSGATLPGFASTPTVNLGTLNGAATAANQPTLNGDGGALAHVTNFPSAQTVQYGWADPCMANAHAFTPISVTSAVSTQIVTNAGSKKIYVCHIFLIAGTADNVAIVEGTGTTCGTSTAGVIGGATAANGVNAAANGGFAIGAGQMSIAATATSGDNLCLITSSAGPLSGVAVTVQQ